MIEQLIIGPIAGTVFYLIKLGLYALLSKLLPFLRRWMDKHIMAQVARDILCGWFLMYMIPGGSALGALIIVTFGVWCILQIVLSKTIYETKKAISNN